MNFKEQQVARIWSNFNTAKAAFFQHQENPAAVLNVEFQLDSITPFHSPFDLLQEFSFVKIGLNGRPLHLATTLIRTADSLRNVINIRNRLVQEFHDSLQTNSSSDNTKHYFGQMDSNGIHNTRISDNIEALHALTEDAIEFCRRLCKDLERHGELLKKSMKLKLPNVNQTDFRIAEDKGLMPDPKNYRDWDDDRYGRKKPSWIQRFWSYITRSRVH